MERSASCAMLVDDTCLPNLRNHMQMLFEVWILVLTLALGVVGLVVCRVGSDVVEEKCVEAQVVVLEQVVQGGVTVAVEVAAELGVGKVANQKGIDLDGEAEEKRVRGGEQGRK